MAVGPYDWRRKRAALEQPAVRCWLVLVLLLLGSSPQAWAQRAPVYEKQAAFARRGKHLTMSMHFAELFDAKQVARLRSGFATSVVMRVYLYEHGSGRPVFATARTLRAVYDLWDETYRLQIDDAGGKRVVRLKETRALVARLGSFRTFPLLLYDELRPAKSYFVAVLVEINPMSPEVLAAVRRWLRKPLRRQVGGDSLFGSFVSIFVNDKIRRAERTFKLRSQSFYRVK